MRIHLIVATWLLLLTAACVSGTADYRPPTSVLGADNSKVIPKSRDEVWSAAVPALGKQFYVINNVDRASGLINMSFSVSPPSYVDCGTLDISVTNARGTAHYNFGAASPEERYMAHSPQGGLMNIHRRMSLEGRVNLIFEELAAVSTRVTANVRYTLTRTAMVQPLSRSYPQTFTESISFNSGGRASFPPQGNAQVQCVPTGALEEHILSLIE